METDGLKVDHERVMATEIDGKSSATDPAIICAQQPQIGRYPNWSALRWLFLFRLLIVVGLILNFSPANPNLSAAKSDPQWAWNILVVYTLLVLLSGFGLSLRRPRQEQQVQVAIFIDILTFTLLMQAAGGVTSGLGILLAVAVAAGALMLEGRLSLLFAALASIAVISQQVYALFLTENQAISFTHAGLLGLLFFAVALLSHVLYRRVRLAEDLAARRQVDIDDLSKLNEFIIQSINTGILVADGERHLRLMNQAARELLGVRRFRNGIALSKLSPKLCAWLMDRVKSTPPYGGSLEIGNRQLSISVKLLGDYRASGVILYLRDTQDVAREAQQSKLASLGTLTASIAHNIRNPLSAITHASQLMAEDPGLSDDNRHLTEIIRRNSARIEETVHSVLQLSRRQEMMPAPIQLDAWLTDFVAEFRESHELDDRTYSLEPITDEIRVEADPRHLHQILANLCENSLVHGHLDGRPTHIRVRLSSSTPQTKAVLEIIDAGPGIDEATAQEIFNPFFTTKSQGTGLGLYIARELSETNGIRLSHHPAKPHGCCFRLTFPDT